MAKQGSDLARLREKYRAAEVAWQTGQAPSRPSADPYMTFRNARAAYINALIAADSDNPGLFDAALNGDLVATDSADVAAMAAEIERLLADREGLTTKLNEALYPDIFAAEPRGTVDYPWAQLATYAATTMILLRNLEEGEGGVKKL